MATDDIFKGFNHKEAIELAKNIENSHPHLKLYLVEGYFRGKIWTIRFELPKVWHGKTEQWFDEEHKKKSIENKIWKCNKFAQLAYKLRNDPDIKEKMKQELFNEW